MKETEKRSKAWIGDAVLALFAREWILKQSDILPGERVEVFTGMTSNRFLACLGEPTGEEAKIGAVYEKDGLKGAFAYIEETILPVFKKQRRNLARGVSSYRDRKK
jgi:dsRNA-specific ribonuclease